ncbi:MAG: hypothetical protein IPK78_19640 [Rhodospirillales bacterium]|nr:hypothetical protein [Rhodospirillales bacterium]
MQTIAWDAPIEEDARQRTRRRLQQRRCLVCSSRALANRATSYFCVSHIATHRYCGVCETLRTATEHGNDLALPYVRRHGRWRTTTPTLSGTCIASDPAVQYTPAQSGGSNLRRHPPAHRAGRSVASTPGASWQQRAAHTTYSYQQLAAAYREQCAGLVHDADYPERLRGA